MSFDLAYDYDTYFIRNPAINKSDIEELKTWVENQKININIPKNMTRKQILVFYIVSKQDVEKTKKRIKSHYSVRVKSPELFNNRNVHGDDIAGVHETQEFLYIREKTDDGYSIILHRVIESNIERYSFIAGCKYFNMLLDSQNYENGPDKGVIVIYDMQNCTFGHVTRTPLEVMTKYLEYSLSGINARPVAIHIFNVSPLINIMMKILHTITKKHMLDKTVFHSRNMNWEKFYKDFIPKKCLPSDFGGDLPDTQTIHKQNAESMSKHQEYFEAEEKQRLSYSKNTMKKSEIVEPSFRYIDID